MNAHAITNRLMAIARTHDAERKAQSTYLHTVYTQVAAVAMTRIGTSAKATQDAITLLDAIRDAKHGEASSEQHGLIARSYNAMRDLGLVD